MGAAAPAAATTTTSSDAPAPDASTGSSKKRRTSADAGSSTGPAKASSGAVKQLQHLSGAAYQKQVDKLGKTISTGGSAPPKDHKAPAGGGSFEDIG